MSNLISVVIPQELRNKAKNCQINISEVCREALAEKVSKAEKEAGESRQASAPTANTRLNPNSARCDDEL
jgi:post-segregation antitoxin (ccd killing protein)